ncbi:MAG: CvpA family protein [Candidatus Tumulicola sp.]
MIGGFAWPDVVIVLVVVATTLKGYSRGFVRELGGAVAIAAALIAPWYYNGSADPQIEAFTRLGSGPAHIAGMVLTGIVAYVVVFVAVWILNRIAKLPILGIGNALAGAIVGFVKGAILVWIILFVALFFALTPPIRASLHASRLVPYFTQFDGAIGAAIENTIPPFARPLLSPFFARHDP